RIDAGLVESFDAGGSLAVGQGEDYHICTKGRQLLVGRSAVAQLAAILGHVRVDALAIEFARGDKAKLQRRMSGDQANQLGAGMAARADDADAFLVHVFSPSRSA